MERIDLTGQRFGRLVVERLVGSRGYKRRWQCRCDCGGEKQATTAKLRNGWVQSCGCLHREVSRRVKLVHGGHGTREYRIWLGMIRRCTNPNERAYRLYGARGITVCDEWRASFAAFIRDMGPRPSPSHSLDRIDNDGPYAPDNCRWASRRVQANNSRKNRTITVLGVTRTLAEWAREVGLRPHTISTRIDRYGWPPERALFQPVTQ